MRHEVREAHRTARATQRRYKPGATAARAHVDPHPRLATHRLATHRTTLRLATRRLATVRIVGRHATVRPPPPRSFSRADPPHAVGLAFGGSSALPLLSTQGVGGGTGVGGGIVGVTFGEIGVGVGVSVGVGVGVARRE